MFRQNVYILGSVSPLILYVTLLGKYVYITIDHIFQYKKSKTKGQYNNLNLVDLYNYLINYYIIGDELIFIYIFNRVSLPHLLGEYVLPLSTFHHQYFYIKTENHINLKRLHQDHNFQNTLFYIEVEGNNMEFNVPIEYDQPISFRHKISKKYLTIIAD